MRGESGEVRGEWGGERRVESREWVRAIIPDGTCTLYSVSCTLSVSSRFLSQRYNTPRAM